MNIGERVKQLRLNKGLTQEELSEMLGYKSKSSVAHIENGRDIPRSMVVKLAELLDTTPAYLMGWIEEAIETHKTLKKFHNDENTSQQVKDTDKFIDDMIAISEKPYDDKPTFLPQRGGLKAAKIKKLAPDEVGNEPIAIKATNSDWERILSNMSDDNRQKLQDYAELLLLKQDQGGQGD